MTAKTPNRKPLRALAPAVDAAVAQTQQATSQAVQALIEAGHDPAEAEKQMTALHLHNLEMMSDPTRAAVNLLAELKTRIDVDRAINIARDPEGQIDLLDKRYLKLLEEMRKTVDLVRKTQPTALNVFTQGKNDGEMRFTQFIDVEDEE